VKDRRRRRTAFGPWREDDGVDAWQQAFVGALLKEASALVDPAELARAPLRLLVAAVAVAAIGVQRQHVGRKAGLRTHMLVSLGAALTVVAAIAAGMSPEHVSRVMQGVSAGIGFIGGGGVLKLTEKQEVRGLTSAAGLWMIAAIGMAAGLGR
jgi:putative Mg2+ transporter-C (MgtC) family protein